MSKICIACSCSLFLWGNGSEKEGSSERRFAKSLQNRDWLWPKDPHKNELICRAGQGLRGPYGFSCLLPFLTGQQVAPEKDICTKYVLRYRKELLERSTCLEIRVLGHCTVCTKNECSGLDSMSKSVFADPITSQQCRARTE